MEYLRSLTRINNYDRFCYFAKSYVIKSPFMPSKPMLGKINHDFKENHPYIPVGILKLMYRSKTSSPKTVLLLYTGILDLEYE